MNCRKSEKWMNLAADNELDTKRQRELDLHLAACPDCRAAQQHLQLFGSILREQGNEASVAAEAMWQDVRRQIRLDGDAGTQQAAQHGAWNPLRRIALTAACLLVISAGAIWYGLKLPTADSSSSDSGLAGVEMVETDLSDATLIVYKDDQTDAVIVWVTAANGEPVWNDPT